jgi:hypothetical protein
VNRAKRIGASVASAALAVVVGPSVVVPVGSGTTLRYVLLRRPRSALWTVVAIDNHYPMHQNYLEYSVPV